MKIYLQLTPEEKIKYLKNLLRNRKLKPNDLAVALRFQDKNDPTGKNIDQIYKDLARNLDLNNNSDVKIKIYTEYYPNFKSLYSSLWNMIYVGDSVTVKLRNDELEYDQFQAYALEENFQEHKDDENPKIPFIKSNDLERKYFEPGSFFCKFNGDYEPGLWARTNYCIKAGPLLFSINIGGKNGFEANLCYLDYEAKSKQHLYGVKQPRYSGTGDLIKLFLPFCADPASSSGARISNTRLFKKAIETTEIVKRSEEFRKVLLNVIQNKTHHPKTELMVLRQGVKQYGNAMKLLFTILKDAESKEKLVSTIIINSLSSPDRLADYFMDQKNPSHMDEKPKTIREVAEKILAIYYLYLSISDKNIQIILCQYFSQNKFKQGELILNDFIKEIYHLELDQGRYNLSDYILENDFNAYTQQAWADYQENPNKNFLIDKSDFDQLDDQKDLSSSASSHSSSSSNTSSSSLSQSQLWSSGKEKEKERNNKEIKVNQRRFFG